MRRHAKPTTKSASLTWPIYKTAYAGSLSFNVDALLEALRIAQSKLDESGIRNAVIGGLAVAAWGRPRVTDDVDVKVDVTRSEVEKLVELMAPEFRPVESAVEHAKSIGVLFLDGPDNVRLDLLLADLGFDGQALERAVEREVVPGFSARLCTAEDLILYKLITTRPRDREDVRSVLQEQGDQLDRAYVEHWLGLFEQALDDSTLVPTFRAMLQEGETTSTLKRDPACRSTT